MNEKSSGAASTIESLTLLCWMLNNLKFNLKMKTKWKKKVQFVHRDLLERRAVECKWKSQAKYRAVSSSSSSSSRNIWMKLDSLHTYMMIRSTAFSFPLIKSDYIYIFDDFSHPLKCSLFHLWICGIWMLEAYGFDFYEINVRMMLSHSLSFAVGSIRSCSYLI